MLTTLEVGAMNDEGAVDEATLPEPMKKLLLADMRRKP